MEWSCHHLKCNCFGKSCCQCHVWMEFWSTRMTQISTCFIQAEGCTEWFYKNIIGLWFEFSKSWFLGIVSPSQFSCSHWCICQWQEFVIQNSCIEAQKSNTPRTKNHLFFFKQCDLAIKKSWCCGDECVSSTAKLDNFTSVIVFKLCLFEQGVMSNMTKKPTPFEGSEGQTFRQSLSDCRHL